MSEVEIQNEINKAVEEENYELAQELQDQITTDEFNYAEQLTRTLKENAALPVEEQEDLDLNGALKKLGKTRADFEKFLRRRVDQVFLEFQIHVNNEFAPHELPSFIANGVTKTKDSTAKDADIARTNRVLNLKDNKTYNLKQIFINDWLNTTAINDILLGDQAVSLKDGVDAVKRAKMQNAAYYSAASRIAAPELGVKNPLQQISMFAVTDPIATSIHTNEEIEQADAQNWMTVKAFRYMWFGFGKLSPAQAKLLDKVETGEEITAEEIFGAAGAAKKQEMLNSKKLVYGDGKVFDKFSVIPLSKAMTSMKDANGNWVAKPGREKLHNMRVKMEQFEQEQLEQGIETVAMVAPLSALKMMKKNITLIDDFVGTSDKVILWAGRISKLYGQISFI
jgi:hypothetical protein